MSRPSLMVLLYTPALAAVLLVPLTTVMEHAFGATVGEHAGARVGESTSGASCGNGVCESGEDCNTCPSDCLGVVPAPPICGDGICEPYAGEDCVSCAADCAGRQSGRPSERYCCGDGDGTNPVDCGDPRCTAGGYACEAEPSGGFCCGDGVCDEGETTAECPLDCGA